MNSQVFWTGVKNELRSARREDRRAAPISGADKPARAFAAVGSDRFGRAGAGGRWAASSRRAGSGADPRSGRRPAARPPPPQVLLSGLPFGWPEAGAGLFDRSTTWTLPAADFCARFSVRAFVTPASSR